uniref:Uncharacterized protein n=1 Tax=Escherichia coli TaxID=562 RepID=A0A7G9AA23_ECOLX|nr:hypothetical protein [Escherichia coli]
MLNILRTIFFFFILDWEFSMYPNESAIWIIYPQKTCHIK